MDYVTEFYHRGYRVMGIHHVNSKGECGCGNQKCEAQYKHPSVKNWQLVPDWSQEQFDTFMEIGTFNTGWGVLMSGLFVIDVDARNGGVESFRKLCLDVDIDLEQEAGFIVMSGSGNGSMHLYFKSPEPPVALLQSLPQYKGIDFKSTGFVVGCGSQHKSGNRYHIHESSDDIDAIDHLPEQLIALLRRPDKMRTRSSSGVVDISLQELKELVKFIPNNDEDYEHWISIGMGLHQTTGGSLDGLDLWEDWSSKSSKHDDTEMGRKWHSFGKSSNSVTLGTLMHHARIGGYVAPVTLTQPQNFDVQIDDILDTSHVDLTRPHGFIGQLTAWINSQCLFPRESLAVAAALYVVSAVGGMRNIDAESGMSGNVIFFCLSDSSTGKESILKAITECLKEVHLMPALHGKFKSEQELMRNLVRHQLAAYLIDELGLELGKISNAQKRGGAAYLEGLVGLIMSAYSKADGTLAISGDMKQEIKDQLLKEASRIQSRLDKGAVGLNAHELEQELKDITRRLLSVENGIENPFLTIFGVTTPVTFDHLVDFESATNGFVGRAMIFREHNSHPRRKDLKEFTKSKKPLPEHLKDSLRRMYSGGYAFAATETRIAATGEVSKVSMTLEAQSAMEAVYEAFHAIGERELSRGLESIPRRGWEITAKIALLMGMESGVIELADVQFAYAMAKRDIEGKIKLAFSNEAETSKDDRGNAGVMRLLSYLDASEAISKAQLFNKMRRKFSKEEFESFFEFCVKNDLIIVEEEVSARNGRIVQKVKLV